MPRSPGGWIEINDIYQPSSGLHPESVSRERTLPEISHAMWHPVACERCSRRGLARPRNLITQISGTCNIVQPPLQIHMWLVGKVLRKAQHFTQQSAPRRPKVDQPASPPAGLHQMACEFATDRPTDGPTDRPACDTVRSTASPSPGGDTGSNPVGAARICPTQLADPYSPNIRLWR